MNTLRYLRIAEGNERVEKELNLALKLLDIVLEIDSAYHHDFRPGSKGFVDRHINTKKIGIDSTLRLLISIGMPQSLKII